MTTCLLGLGSNEGDREGMLRAALAAIDALPDVRVVRQSKAHPSRPIGGPANQGEFLNSAAVIDTSVPPLRLLAELQDIEARHGRKRMDRWAPRTIDIDVLLYGQEVVETEMLTLPHPRMSFRRFVLEPAAEVAPRLIHPVIGWPVERLLLHLNAASDLAAIVSPSEALRRRLAEMLCNEFGAQTANAPSFATAERLWPATLTTWLGLHESRTTGGASSAQTPGLPYAAAAFPKLNVLLDADASPGRGGKSEWSAVVRQPGRGAMLRLQIADEAVIQAEVAAAVRSVWPDLGPIDETRLK